MFRRTYHLDRQKYINDMDMVKNALQILHGVSEVQVNNRTNSVVVEFDHTLSEKQILSTINLYKIKQ